MFRECFHAALRSCLIDTAFTVSNTSCSSRALVLFILIYAQHLQVFAASFPGFSERDVLAFYDLYRQVEKRTKTCQLALISLT